MSAPHLVFYVGWTRPWRPVKGCEAPEGQVCELRSLPGNLMAAGSTLAEAQERLNEAVDRAITRRGSFARWYTEAMAKMTKDDGDQFLRAFKRSVEESSVSGRTAENGDKYETATVMVEEECAA